MIFFSLPFSLSTQFPRCPLKFSKQSFNFFFFKFDHFCFDCYLFNFE
jgi:hypothetical protein